MKVDIFAHLVPPKVWEHIKEKDYYVRQSLVERIGRSPGLYNLDHRFRLMDKYPDIAHVVTFPWASPVEMAGPNGAVDLARRINDEFAELTVKYPDRFAGAGAVLPTSDIDATLKEIDRAITELGLRGIELRIPVDGQLPVDSSQLFPVYEKMCQYNLPIWWHPQNTSDGEYPGEPESLYNIWHLWGLPMETTRSMTRFVLSGCMEKFSGIKIITHHLGGMVPFFAERLESRHMRAYTPGLKEPPIEYFRRFYNDTAIEGNTSALMCAYDFFGAEHMLFATDFMGDSYLINAHRIPEAIERMDISSAEKEMIFEGNAKTLMNVHV